MATLSASGADIVLGDGTFTKVGSRFVIVSAPGSRRGQFTGGLAGSNDYNPSNDRVDPSGVSTYPVYYDPLSACVSGTAARGGAAFGLEHTSDFVSSWSVADAGSALLALWDTIGGASASEARAALLTPLPLDVVATRYGEGLNQLTSLVSDALPAVTSADVRVRFGV